jgi:hypothetical protein
MQHQFLDEAGQQAAVATPPMRLTSLSPAASRAAPGSVGRPTAAMASVIAGGNESSGGGSGSRYGPRCHYGGPVALVLRTPVAVSARCLPLYGEDLRRGDLPGS